MLWFLLLMLVGSAISETNTNEENTGTLENGVLTIRDEFQIFPVGKKGNTIYFNNTKIVSKPDLVLHDAISLFDGYVYYGTNEENESILGFEGNPEISFAAIDGGYYGMITPEGQKKILRISPQKTVQVLLPSFNTTSGLVFNGFKKAAFYHIYKGETVETEDGSLKYQYTFKIHIVRSNEDEIDTLHKMVTDFSPSLKLKWMNKDRLQYRLSDGRKYTIVVQ